MSGNKEYYPLTHPQKAIWYTEKLCSGTSIGNLSATLKIKGHLDLKLFEHALNIFIEQNDGIRLQIAEK